MVDHFYNKGGEVHTEKALKKWLVDETNGNVTGVELTSGEIITGDHYVSAMAVDAFKLTIPDKWMTDTDTKPFFTQLNELKGNRWIFKLHLFPRNQRNQYQTSNTESTLVRVFFDLFMVLC